MGHLLKGKFILTCIYSKMNFRKLEKESPIFPIDKIDQLFGCENEETINLTSLKLANLDISSIPDNSFKKFKSLKELILTGNLIRKINLNTFKGLENLETLQLDRIREIEANSFGFSLKLKKISMAG